MFIYLDVRMLLAAREFIRHGTTIKNFYNDTVEKVILLNEPNEGQRVWKTAKWPHRL